MFNNDYKNSKEGTIIGISNEAFADFLQFVYTGEAKNPEKHAREILVVADRYEIDDLKAICEMHLLAGLTNDDAINIFEIAHKSRCSMDLKKAAFDRIKK